MNRSLLLLLAGAAACVPDPAAPPSATPTDEWDDKLAEREVDYSAALRIASLRLTGELPTLVEVERIANALDDQTKRTAYEELVRGYLAGPKFTRQMVAFAKDTLRMGDDPEKPQLDAAPAFYAQVIVDNRSYLDLLTATAGTCPTYDPIANTFAAADCNNSGVTAGLLTHPAMHEHFFGNLAFRRVRWVQEMFACTTFPAEMAEAPTDVSGATPYTGKFPFTSIAGKANGGRVDFLSTSSVICANCHSNMNHIAPLFAHYDQAGRYSPAFVAPLPLPNEPAVAQSDYLPTGEGMAWRFGVPVTDMTSLAAAMAADKAIAECAVARVWNWAMGKADIVDGGARVPSATIEQHVNAFVSGGYKLRDTMYGVFTSDDFTKF